MFERFTDRARRVVVLAQEEARLLDHGYIGTEHLLLGLIHERDGVAARALELSDVSLGDVRARVREIIGTGGGAPPTHIPFTPRAKRVLELGLREALQLGHNSIGTEHLLLGLLREGEGVAAQVLVALGVELAAVRAVVLELLSGGSPEPPPRSPFEHPFFPPMPGVGSVSVLRAASSAAGPHAAVCGFCGVASPACGALFTGSGGALVCERCVRALAAQLPGAPTARALRPPRPPSGRNPLEWEGGSAMPTGSLALEPPLDALAARHPATGPPPEDEVAARAAVEAAFVGINARTDDGLGLVNVEHGDGLAAYAEQVEARVHRIAAGSVQVIELVKFVDERTAVAWMTTTLLDGRPIGPIHRRECRAVLVDGTWKVAFETARELWALAGVHCPPRTTADG